MNRFNTTTRLDVELQQADSKLGAISYFHCAAEGEFDILLPTAQELFALIINPGPASNSYVFNGVEDGLPIGRFNMFYIPSNSIRWKFKEGLNNFLVVRVTASTLKILFKDDCLKNFIEQSGPSNFLALNDTAHLITPV
jgi:hypothetical protein